MDDLFFKEIVAILVIFGVWLFCIGKQRRMAVINAIIRIVITTVIVGVACRFRWEMSGPYERIVLQSGGPDNLMLWAMASWAVVFLMVNPLIGLLGQVKWRRQHVRRKQVGSRRL
jgi:hypothetical protein